MTENEQFLAELATQLYSGTPSVWGPFGEGHYTVEQRATWAIEAAQAIVKMVPIMEERRKRAERNARRRARHAATTKKDK